MPAHNGGDDFFSDDELDNLPNHYLDELETNAIQFTQAQTQAGISKPAAIRVPPSSDYGDDIDDEDLDDAVVIDESRSTPARAIIPALQRNIPGQLAQRQALPQQRYGTISNPHSTITYPQRNNVGPPPLFNLPNPTTSRISIPQNESMVVEQDPDPGGKTLQLPHTKYTNILKLLKERDALKSGLNAKAGEIAIVRSKQEKAAKQYEREMAALRKLNEDKLAKQEKALEAARIAEKNAATEREFIRRDLAEETEKVRRMSKIKEAETKGALLTTPKKKKALPHRDGFDDDEIEFLSPSKLSPSKFQKKVAGSPSRVGSKRRRKTVESPIAALEVQVDDEPTEKPEAKNLVFDESIIDSLSRQDDRFDFLGTMLDHRLNPDHLRTVQELDKYALPSTPKESFQSVLLGKIPVLGLKKSQKALPIDFCELLISMWSSCMKEKYLAPIYLLIDLLTFALELKTTSVAPHITDSIVPLAQLTADLVVIPRFKGHSTEAYDKSVNVSSCLALLHLVALGCMPEQEHITRFWKFMRYDFVLVMLSPNHPTPDFEMMLPLLSTSVFRDSFGAITVEGIPELQVVDNILERLTYTLFEIPPLPGSSEKMELGALSKLRLNVLQLMTSMTRSSFASRAMAMHPLTIGRLVSLISDELDDLYDYKARHEESARIISLATRLLYHIVTRFGDDIDIQKKLAVIRGGSQKYLLSLSRLNFTEDDLLLESGIDPDVAAYALEMLERVVTPEEGDAIHSAFSTS
ncbi:Uncharacterized protein BP5553_10693 [Venustampulla echinocandica]|uniref:DNA repair protein Rad26 n=1 Tax=Venustampulla echinocandica TaxID=2656787 RepID=A0A370T8M1_9HELO|nr:Uncharacterized protein BP5553_10693 [Venustampulla echinocandica]RDL29713.1 Uncharacterized protein BP5553_10693 [Venustampulla echinocandica]